MRILILLTIANIFLVSCLSDKAEVKTAGVEVVTPTKSTAVASSEDARPAKKANKKNATAKKSPGKKPATKKAKNNASAELGQWEKTTEIERSDFRAKSIAGWLKYAIVCDNKDSCYIINTKTGLNFDSLAVRRSQYVTVSNSRLLIPTLRGNKILVFRGDELYPLETFDKLSRPTAVMAYSISHYLVLDRGNSSILYKNGDEELIIGQKGKGKADMMNPENFEVVDSTKIYVLDSGNKRVQVYDTAGEALFNFGQKQKFNRVTGITSDETRIFVSDFEKGLIYIYDHDGNYLGDITEHMNNPSDIHMKGGTLYIANQNGPEVILLKEIGTE